MYFFLHVVLNIVVCFDWCTLMHCSLTPAGTSQCINSHFAICLNICRSYLYKYWYNSRTFVLEIEDCWFVFPSFLSLRYLYFLWLFFKISPVVQCFITVQIIWCRDFIARFGKSSVLSLSTQSCLLMPKTTSRTSNNFEKQNWEMKLISLPHHLMLLLCLTKNSYRCVCMGIFCQPHPVGQKKKNEKKTKYSKLLHLSTSF